MYWVSRKVLMLVMPNPYNPLEKIKKSKADVVFTDIQDEYLRRYTNTWNRSLIPLEFFAKEYSKRSGQDELQIIEMFEKYFEQKGRELNEN